MSRTSTPAKRDYTASTLLAGVLVAVAVTGVATVSATGSGVLQRAMEFAGFGQGTAAEHEQDRQAARIAGLDAMIVTMSNELGDVARQQQVSGSQHDDLIKVIGELDREVVTLRDQIAREGLFQQDTVLRGALTELSALQADVEQNKAETQKAIAGLSETQAAQETTLAAVAKRLSQVEDTLAQREVTSSISTPKPPRRRVKIARSKPRLAPPPVLNVAPDTIER
jgi:chromosome segregation ATPase